jgi:hypothetical protein
MENKENIQSDRMSAEEVALVLSKTMKDVRDRKITLRYALVVSRLALAITKTIETVELKGRVEFLEQVLKRRK